MFTSIIIILCCIGCIASYKDVVSFPKTLYIDEMNNPDIHSYLRHGADLEAVGALTEAYSEYKKAKKVASFHSELIQIIDKRIYDLAEKFHCAAIDAFKKKKFSQGRNHLLTAFQLCPVHPKIVKGHAIHHVESHDNLWTLAQQYLNDPYIYPVIAEYNYLPHDCVLTVNQSIKIPKIKGLTFDIPKLHKQNIIVSQPVFHPVIEKKQYNSPITEKKNDQTTRTLKPKINEFKQYPIINDIDLASVVTSSSVTMTNHYTTPNPNQSSPNQSSQTDLSTQDKKAFNHPIDQHAFLLYQNGEYAKALERIKQVCETIDNQEQCTHWIQKWNKIYTKFSEGLKYLKESEYFDAIDAFRYVLLHNPSDQVAKDYLDKLHDHFFIQHFQKGDAFFEQADYEEALEQYYNAAAYKSYCDSCEERINICKMVQQNLKAGQNYMAKQRYDLAKDHFLKVLVGHPGNETAQTSLSAIFLQQGKALLHSDEVAARDAFQKALSYKKDCASCDAYIKQCDTAHHWKKGISLYNVAAYAHAAKEFDMVLTLDPNNPDALTMLYQSLVCESARLFHQTDYLKVSQVIKRIVHYKQTCRNCPDYIQLYPDKDDHVDRGILYKRTKQYSDMLKEIGLIYILDPTYREIGEHVKDVKNYLPVLLLEAKQKMNKAEIKNDQAAIKRWTKLINSFNQAQTFLSALEDMKRVYIDGIKLAK